MGSQGGEDSQQGSGSQTQQGGGLWSGAGQAAAGRPRGPIYVYIDKSGGMVGERSRPRNLDSSVGK